MRWHLLVLTRIVLLSTLVLFGCRPKAGQPDPKAEGTINLVLAEGMQPVCSPIYIADQKGFFKGEGLNVKLVPFQKGKLCLDAVLGGKADLGTVAETPLMHVGFQKQPVAILCTMHSATKNTKCVARKDKGIGKPEDLKGHAVGVPIGGNAEYFMDRFLQKYGLGRADVKIVNLNPPEMVGAMVRGDIDASFSWEPHVTRTINQLGEKAEVFLGEDLYRETFNLVCMRSWAVANTRTCEKVLRALAKATDFIHKNKDESVGIVANRLQMEPKELAGIWDCYTFQVVLDQFLMDSLVNQAKWAIAAGTQQGGVPDYRYMFYADPLRTIDKSAVSAGL